jgi:hypothetical protein
MFLFTIVYGSYSAHFERYFLVQLLIGCVHDKTMLDSPATGDGRVCIEAIAKRDVVGMTRGV